MDSCWTASERPGKVFKHSSACLTGLVLCPVQERAEATNGRDDGIDAGPSDIPASQTTVLEGHELDVFCAAWSPDSAFLATG